MTLRDWKILYSNMQTLYAEGLERLRRRPVILVGGGCKLVQFVVYCMLFVMMLTNTEKKSAVSEEGHVLTGYGFFWS